MSDTTIAELAALAEVEELEERVSRRNGIRPYGISHWDPSPAYQELVGCLVEYPVPKDTLVRYNFSYECHSRKQVLAKIGALSEKEALLTPNGSTSILCLLNLFKSLRLKVLALTPTYFTVRASARMIGLPFREASLQWSEEHGFTIPWDIADQAKPGDVLWLTNPIYCTGTTYPASDLAALTRLMDRGVAVAVDECLCPYGAEMFRLIGDHPLFFGIQSPHKSICMNGFKYSVAVFDARHEDAMDLWADPIYGCLSWSSVGAISHFLSDNFDTASHALQEKIRRSSNYVRGRVAHFPRLRADAKTIGYLCTVYVPDLPAKLGLDLAFLEEIMESSGCSIITGARNRFPNESGFCFRINLTRDDPSFRFHLERLLAFLSTA